MSKTRPLTLEPLEDRLTPAIWGIPWPDGQHLTLSFAPDGTTGGLTPSNLFRTLNAKAPTSAWQLEVLRAFQTWAVNANINIGLVGDGGQALGAAGAVQGDSRFGDIRIAANSIPLLNAIDIADSQPFLWTGTTWSGDVIFDSSMNIGIGNQPGQYDLYTVALHEAGHSFGFADETSDPTSIMYRYYQGAANGLSPLDIQSLQALYGKRQPDSFDLASANDTMATATSLTTNLAGVSVNADISTLQDADWYRFTTPNFLTGVSGFSVQVKTSGISLLMPSVAVYDAGGHALASTWAGDPLHNDLSLQMNARPSTTYYVRVGNATQSVFGVGSYQLNVINQYGTLSLGGLLNGLPPLGNLVHNTLATALNLLPLNLGTDLRWDYLAKGSLTSPTGTDYYLMKSPASAAGGTETMVAMAWALDVNGLTSRIQVYDAFQNPLPFQVIANDGNTFTIQVANIKPGASYFVEVAAANPTASNRNTGNYSLAVNFHQSYLSAFDTVTSGTLTAAQPTSSQSFTATDNELVHFALSANSANAAAVVTMTLVDANGRTVLSLTVGAGQPTVTDDIYLSMGTYSIRFSAQTTDGSALGSIDYLVAGDVLSDRMGAYATKPPSPPPN